jgi:hypothetical protein
VGPDAHSFQCASRFILAKTKSAQCAKRLSLHIGHVRTQQAAIARTVCVSKMKSARYPSLDVQLPAVLRSVVRGTEDDEVFFLVISAL